MNVTQFFTNFSSIVSYKHPVICFTGKTYQPLFFERLKKYIEQQTGDSFKTINIDFDISQVQSQLSTTFLGQTSWYWLSNIGLISSKKKKSDYLNFIKNYSGPHRLLVFIPESDITTLSNEIMHYVIQENYQYDQIKKIPILYDDQKTEILAYFYSKLYRLKKEYSLDQLCLLKEYASLLGKNMNQFFDTWIEQLIISDVSLFHLSQLFFEKQSSEFFRKWQDIRKYYADQFWTAYFSEQLFKASFYIRYQGQVPTDQKQLLFGLPFSFIKHDWQLYHIRELQAAHQKLYTIDLSLKRGGNIHQLDSFCMLFFSNAFH